MDKYTARRITAYFSSQTEQWQWRGTFYVCVWAMCSVVSDSLWPHGLQAPPGSPVHGIFPTIILEWVAIFSFKGSSWCRDWTFVSCTGRQILYHLATREALFFFLTYWKRTSDPDFQTQPKHLSKNEGKWWLFQKNNSWENSLSADLPYKKNWRKFFR